MTPSSTAFAPAQVDALPGETVEWSNVSPRVHTVTSDAGLFGTDELLPGRRLLAALRRAGRLRLPLHDPPGDDGRGRRAARDPRPAADGGRCRSASASRSRAAPPIRRGRWRSSAASAAAPSRPSRAPRRRRTAAGARRSRPRRRPTTARPSAATSSQTRRLLVSARRVRLRATRRGVAVTVTPSAPYAPHHAAGRPARALRLVADRARAARLPLAGELPRAGGRRACARVLVAKDGWTPLATSRVSCSGTRSRRTPAAAGMHMHGVVRAPRAMRASALTRFSARSSSDSSAVCVRRAAERCCRLCS